MGAGAIYFADHVNDGAYVSNGPFRLSTSRFLKLCMSEEHMGMAIEDKSSLLLLSQSKKSRTPTVLAFDRERFDRESDCYYLVEGQLTGFSVLSHQYISNSYSKLQR